MDWYILALISLFCYGITHFLYKVSAEKRCNTAWTSFSFMLTVAVLSSILFFVFKESVTNIYLLLLIAFINATTFFTSTITGIEALKHIPTTVAYPLIRLSTAVVVIFSILYFKDKLSFYQIIGIVLAFVVILILTRQNYKEKIKHKDFRLGIILIVIAFVASAATTIVQKFAAMMVNKFGYIAISYIYNTFFSLGLRKKLQTERENPNHRNALVIGFFIGLFNFAGFYSILKAYSLGPLSLIASISSLSFAIAIFLSVLIYKEELTTRRLIGIILTIIAVILLRF